MTDKQHGIYRGLLSNLARFVQVDLILQNRWCHHFKY
ncbi:hypothetical protein J969_1368, partial [Acinetobacter baumannii 26016_3]